MSTFAGTARYYRLYRPGIPAEAVQLLRAEVEHLAPPRRLLDLGTGTGQVPAALHEAFTEIDAVEPDADMVAQADTALHLMIQDPPLRLHRQRAEDFTPPYPGWRADVVTICRAFGWMDQEAVLKKLGTCVSSTGVVAVMSDGSPWTDARSLWAGALRELVQQFLGARRPAGGQTCTHHDRSSAQVLTESAFSQVSEHCIALKRVWTPEQVIGFLYSTSFAARPLFGEAIEEFEEEATTLLEQYTAGGPLLEEVEFQVVLARRRSRPSRPAPASPLRAVHGPGHG
ncbi:class I SAM-dependent methyltransferase [Nonomuraea turkmeniaca]|uniref:Class I SAM-dependent methyltransferase n=1 Tax=Nonomuraea turkmeniaca TaxID=103838 RepID=A0A5S4EUV4_9ACTN|nr:class I SAM-dependent methyltransferase [Nonomuraea turkmeniaca]TMR06570.1 class I SAM-dependent methyltransferase [Nonomuraea turkmeniaca]